MKSDEIIMRIAGKEGISPRAVKEEMQCAIREAMKTKDPQAQALWRQLAPDGGEPSIDRFLEFCADRLNQRRGS